MRENPAHEAGGGGLTYRPNLHELQQRTGAGTDPRPIERSRVVEKKSHRDEQAEVADSVGDEGFLSRGGVGVVGVPEADEQIAANPDPFPPDEQDGEVRAHHQDQHREAKQIEIGEEPVKPAVASMVVPHVRGGVEVDQETDAGDDEHHHRAQAIDDEGDLYGRGSKAMARRDLDPAPGGELEFVDRVLRVAGAREQRERGERRQKRTADRGERHQAYGIFAEPFAEHAVDESPEERQAEDHGDQREVLSWEDVVQEVHRELGFVLSVLEEIGLVAAHRAAEAIDRERDGETDSGFGRGDRNDEEGEHLTVVVVLPHAVERDQREIDGVEQKLDAHQLDEKIAPDQKANRANHEHDGGHR